MKFTKIAILLEDDNNEAYIAYINKEDLEIIARFSLSISNLRNIEPIEIDVKFK